MKIVTWLFQAEKVNNYFEELKMKLNVKIKLVVTVLVVTSILYLLAGNKPQTYLESLNNYPASKALINDLLENFI